MPSRRIRVPKMIVPFLALTVLAVPLSTNCRAPRAWQDPAVQVNDLVRCISGCILNLRYTSLLAGQVRIPTRRGCSALVAAHSCWAGGNSARRAARLYRRRRLDGAECKVRNASWARCLGARTHMHGRMQQRSAELMTDTRLRMKQQQAALRGRPTDKRCFGRSTTSATAPFFARPA